MAQPDGAKTRPEKRKENWTQFDLHLIRAAQNNLDVQLYFNTRSIVSGSADMEGKIKVVDRYMVKFLADDSLLEPMWIQKSLIAGVRVIGS